MINEDDFPNEPDDGHFHEFVDADGTETRTDSVAVICVHCGMLSAEDPFEGDEDGNE